MYEINEKVYDKQGDDIEYEFTPDRILKRLDMADPDQLMIRNQPQSKWDQGLVWLS